jgi:hypothetical protein
VIDLLERESFLERTPSGGVATLEWRGALRRWAEEARTVREVVSLSCSEPRGLEYFQRELRQTTLHYAATGSLAAHQLAPAAPLRTAALYVSNPSDLQDALGLREVESGANVLLIESASLPSSSDVSQRNGMFIAPVAQVAVDLLSGTGREPGEGEVLLQWMEDHLNEWRR